MSASIQAYLDKQARLNKRRRILHPMLRAAGSLFCNPTVTGLDNIPDAGATILMMNHITYIDPVIITAVIEDRYAIAMAKAESADNLFQDFFVRLWGNFYIQRGEVDRTALQYAMAILEAGHLLLMAPEGQRAPQGLIQPKGGLAYLAHKTNAVVVPVAVCGVRQWSKQLLRLHRIDAHINFGSPFRLCMPQDKRLSREIRETMMREAMYQLARTIPDDYAHLRGDFADLSAATTHTIRFV